MKKESCSVSPELQTMAEDLVLAELTRDTEPVLPTCSHSGSL